MGDIYRRWPVIVVAVLYIAIGAAGLVGHYPTLNGDGTWHTEDVWIEVTEAIALVAGVFILRRHNWARWLALAWIAFHVLLSVFHTAGEVAIHALLAAVFGWVLFGPSGKRHFGASHPTATVG
jgi:hypothetical protein